MSYEFRLERLIDATPDEVFDAMTNPAAQREWWASGDVDSECDMRVGGTSFVEWTSEDGHRCRAEQTFLEVHRPHRLVFTEVVTEPDAPRYECTLTVTFEDRDGKTLYTLHHAGFPTDEECDKHQRGTGVFLDRLERYLAGARR